MGCKGKYADWITDDGLMTVKGWARDGLSNVQIAANIGISESTFHDWINRFSEFSEALKKGRAPIAVKIEDAFYSKCDWQEYEETREEILEHPDGRKSKKIVRVRHPVPPDTAALIFALKNLRPDKYRDKPVNIDVGLKVEDDALSASLRELAERLDDDATQ